MWSRFCPKRKKRANTAVSPSCNCELISSRAGRWMANPVIYPWKISSRPYFSKRSIWVSIFWSMVETRVYPNILFICLKKLVSKTCTFKLSLNLLFGLCFIHYICRWVFRTFWFRKLRLVGLYKTIVLLRNICLEWSK